MFGIIKFLHKLRCFSESLCRVCASRNHLFSKVTGGRICPSIRVDIPSGSKSEHGMEWSVLDSGMEASIEDVLSSWKEPEPVVLLIIAVESEVLFQFLVGSFC